MRVLTCAITLLATTALPALADGKNNKSMTRGGNAAATDKGTTPRGTLADRIVNMGEGEEI